jgi:hypothetical protein
MCFSFAQAMLEISQGEVGYRSQNAVQFMTQLPSIPGKLELAVDQRHRFPHHDLAKRSRLFSSLESNVILTCWYVLAPALTHRKVSSHSLRQKSKKM